MEPVTVLAITNASMGIARSLVHTIKELYELAEAYETAALGIRTVATQCNSFRIAVDRINKWLVKQNENSRHDLDDDFWLALAGNIDTAKLVMEDLEKRIQYLKKSPTRFWTRTKYLWNGVVIAELQTQIQGLMSAVSILIQVIDIPITGAKRAQSRAQSKRLNGLTVSNQNRAREARRRAQTDEADLLNGAAVNTLPEPQTQHDVLQALQVGPNDPRGAPPAYERSATLTDFASSDLKQPSMSAQEALLAIGTEPPVADVIPSFRVLDRSRSHEQDDPLVSNKWKQSKWKAIMRRPRKPEFNRSNSGPVEATPDGAAPAQDVPSAMQSSTISSTRLKETPAPIEASSGADSYFELENNTSEMSGQKGIAREITPDTAGGTESSNGTHAPTSNSPLEGNLLNNGHNRYRDMRLTSQSGSSRDSKKPDYRGGRADSTDTFYHIRPAQRVLEARERSQSRDLAAPSQTQTSLPATDALGRQISGGSKLSSPRLGSDSENSRQTWQTTAMTNRCVKFKVQFETESFSNRISLPAARALGVEDNIVEYADVPTATLTLLYTVSDGLTAEANTVLGDEAEFAVISEHESRTRVLVLGQGFAHLAQLAEVGELIYWNPGTVPKKLRSIDRLSLYRRFELVRW